MDLFNTNRIEELEERVRVLEISNKYMKQGVQDLEHSMRSLSTDFSMLFRYLGLEVVEGKTYIRKVDNGGS